MNAGRMEVHQGDVARLFGQGLEGGGAIAHQLYAQAQFLSQQAGVGSYFPKDQAPRRYHLPVGGSVALDTRFLGTAHRPSFFFGGLSAAAAEAGRESTNGMGES